jgi:hypothetical protein
MKKKWINELTLLERKSCEHLSKCLSIVSSWHRSVTINKFFSKQIPFIEKGTRWHYNCSNHSTRPFTPEHESGTSSSLSKATTASITNILSEWFWYPKHRSMSRWNYWQALGKMLTTFPMKGICLLKNLFIVWHLGFWRVLRRSQILCVSNIWIHKGMLPRFLVGMHIHVARSFIICVMLCRSLFVLLSLFFGNWLPPKWRTFANRSISNRLPVPPYHLEFPTQQQVAIPNEFFRRIHPSLQ